MNWISVKDRLPELGTRCLILDVDGDVQICNYCKSNWNYPPNSVGFLDEQDEQPSMHYAIYWCSISSLPQPPKTDNE